MTYLRPRAIVRSPPIDAVRGEKPYRHAYSWSSQFGYLFMTGCTKTEPLLLYPRNLPNTLSRPLC